MAQDGGVLLLDAIDGRDVRKGSWRESASAMIGPTNQIFAYDATGGCFRWFIIALIFENKTS
jgi:hypothetical protein